MSEIIRAVFVAWQNPETRGYIPVARLAQTTSSQCQDCFEFVYIQAAREAMQQGFLPFLAFPDLELVYRSRQLFPMFANRVLSGSRPDYAEHLEQLGLPPSTSSPILILSRSGGRRVTDSLELFPLPSFEPDFGYRAWFWAHSLRHLAPTPEKRIMQLHPDERLYVTRDVRNPADSMALKLQTEDHVVVGYMPAYLLDDAHELLDTRESCRVHVDRVNPPPAPIQQRLLCRLESHWPADFVPYSSPRYQPLAQSAATITPPALHPLT